MKPVHILHLIDGLNVGGAEVLLRDLTEGLAIRGYRVSIGYSTPGPLADELAATGLHLTRLPRLARIDPFLLFGMLWLMRSDPPQVVHTHLFKSDFHGRLAARMAGVPVVVSTLHNADIWAQRQLLGALYGFTARFADKLIAVSDEVREYHIAKTGIPAEKVEVIENGVDVRRFGGMESIANVGRSQPKGWKVRSEFGVSQDAILFGIIGRLKPQKDHVNFLKAAAEILYRFPSARFLVVGDGPLRAELLKLADELRLFPALMFIGQRSDIPEVLAALDVLVLSSRWEGLPVTLLEGMAASKPVVATAVDGINGVAVPDSTALLVPPDNHLALADACLRLCTDPDLRARMGRAGFERVSTRYSLSMMIDKTAGLYNSLLRARGLGEMIPKSSTGVGAAL
jgi:glycosyltransferase involved in cell wall biosynthesis